MTNFATVVMPNGYVVQYRDVGYDCRYTLVLLDIAYSDLTESINELYPDISIDNLTASELVMVLEYIRKVKR